MADIPYCGEDTAVENLRLPETVRSTGSRKQSKRENNDGRERMFEIPEFLRKVGLQNVLYRFILLQI